MTDFQLSEKVLKAAFQVHSELGPGLLESVYHACLEYELLNSGLIVNSQRPIHIRYNNIVLDKTFVPDFEVNQRLIVEIKSVERIAPIHHAQLMTYLKICGIQYGLIINFNAFRLKDGIKRIAFGF